MCTAVTVTSLSLAFSLLVAAASGCKKEAPSSTQPSSPPVGSATPVATQPTTPTATNPSQAGILTGRLLERIDAASYSYLRIATAGGEVWAAVTQTDLAVGADVTVTDLMLNQNFESKTLARSFDRIYFGVLGGANPHASAPPAVAPGPAAGAVAVAKVARAEGPDGRTIAELYAQKAKFADKSVSVRGTVVKYTGGVMGKNWLHLRDSTGTDASKDNDVTVTTLGEAALGDVVVIKGTVHLDKDFGAGYAYPLIIEDATLSK